MISFSETYSAWRCKNRLRDSVRLRRFFDVKFQNENASLLVYRGFARNRVPRAFQFLTDNIHVKVFHPNLSFLGGANIFHYIKKEFGGIQNLAQ